MVDISFAAVQAYQQLLISLLSEDLGGCAKNLVILCHTFACEFAFIVMALNESILVSSRTGKDYSADLEGREPLEIGENVLAYRKLSSSIGVEVDGLALKKVGASTAKSIRDLVSKYHVVFIRDFGIDKSDFVQLAEQFGQLSVHPLHEFQGYKDRRVTEISDSKDRPPAGFPWHTDLSWLQNPPRFGFLQALTIPESGGDTLWSSLLEAYETLSDSLKKYCRGLNAVHKIDESLMMTIRNNHGDELAKKFQNSFPEIHHPLVREHPDSGFPLLYLSPMYLYSIASVSNAESEMLLDHLHDVATDPRLCVRWRWQEGDVAIWDESCTLHRALADHFPQERRMRRCTIKGASPLRYVGSDDT